MVKPLYCVNSFTGRRPGQWKCRSEGPLEAATNGKDDKAWWDCSTRPPLHCAQLPTFFNDSVGVSGACLPSLPFRGVEIMLALVSEQVEGRELCGC